LRKFRRQNRPGVRIFVNNSVVASGDPDGFAAAARRCYAFPAGRPAEPPEGVGVESLDAERLVELPFDDLKWRPGPSSRSP
jgi:hypothetical protein